MTSPRQQQVWRNIPSQSNAGSIALMNSSNRLMSDSLDRVSNAFTDWGSSYQEKQNNLFLDQISKSESPEAVAALLSAIPSNTSIDPTKLNSFVSDHQNQLRDTAERNLQTHVDDNYSDVGAKFTPRHNSMMSPFQRGARDEAGANAFLDNVKYPEREKSAVGRFNNFQHMQQTDDFRSPSPGEQELVKAGWLQRQGNDAKNLGSFAAAEDFDSGRSDDALTRTGRVLTNEKKVLDRGHAATDREAKLIADELRIKNAAADRKTKLAADTLKASNTAADRKTKATTAKEKKDKAAVDKELLERLNKKDTTYNNAEYAQLSAEARKLYDRQVALPFIKKFKNLGGGDIESKITKYLEVIQSPKVQALTLPQQKEVSENLMKVGGFNQSTINDQLEHMGLGAETVDNRNVFQKLFGGRDKPAAVSMETVNQITSMLKTPGDIAEFRKSKQYASNPEFWNNQLGGGSE